jgi:hypothetical protein
LIVGANCAGRLEEDALGAGVEDLLPVDGAPISYDWDMAVRAKNEVAAASMFRM